jgi:hypothetical protein
VRLARRILLTAVITVTVVLVAIRWAAPVALSYYSVRKAPLLVRVVPTDLNDLSISQAPGMKLSYLGYEFEVPWTDIDESQTKLYPSDSTEKSRVDLHFRSGLRLLVTVVPFREMVDGLPKEFKVSPQALETIFGRDTMKSDHSFLKAVYEFTPEKMNHWDFRRGMMNRDEFLLILKSMVLSSAANSGIFTIQNQNYVGFQQGNPQPLTHGIVVSLYSEKASVEMIFSQKDYRKSLGITQPEINRVVHSLHVVPQHEATIQASMER